MKSIKEFLLNTQYYIVCNSKEEFLAILELCNNPRQLEDSCFGGLQTTIDGSCRYCNDINYMERNFMFYCNASEILNQAYEIY